MTVTSNAYLDVVRALITRVGEGQVERKRQAVAILAESVRNGGVIQAFGCGHSEAVAMEIAGRAGGLVPTNRIALRDVVLYGGEPLDVLADPMVERRTEIAHRLYDLAPVKPDDVFVIASNSGINGAVVEMARLVKERGHGLIAITSAEHSAGVTSRHPGGHKLGDLADVVLDNGAPTGDAALALPGGGAVGAVSSLTAALLAQQLVTDVVAALVEAGMTPPVYQSDNVAGGRNHNAELEARYAGRIRRIA
ncbi:sugar isomerase domain-containing protein [Paractinoplanes ferrugineus]|uniref:UPF0309 protein n=1 Tax=Paractinoplanes ferrugineus TaxID=113564 RepID=A0A919J9U2_9ACTN|nr:SIS domain-containing protein [Actinoplanes ferrugineus]GIE16400.1 UPF0309 protein [Actinoplanes ferrugineus]